MNTIRGIFTRQPTTFLGMINANRLDLIKKAVQNGEDVNQVFTGGEIAHDNISANRTTPLYVAIWNGEPHAVRGIMGYRRGKKDTKAIVKLLLDLGADPNTKNGYFRTTPLYKALLNGDNDIAKLLIERGADVNEMGNTISEATPIHVVDTKELMTIIIAKGADVNSVDKNGDTPLHAEVRNPELVQILLDNNADPNIRNRNGLTALDVARGEGYEKTIALLEPHTREGVEAIDVNTDFQELSAPELPPFKIDLKKTITFEDPIMLTEEEVNLQEYINEDPDNIIIMYQNSERDTTNRYFLTKRSIIRDQSKAPTNLMFPCKVADERLFVGRDDYHNIPLLSIKSIGFTTGNNYVDLVEFIRNPEQQLFAIYNLQLKYPSFVSKDVLNGGSVVSALHCQPGHASKVSKIYLAESSEQDNTESLFEPEPSVPSEQPTSGGRRVIKGKRSTHKRQSKKKHTTKKHRHKHKKSHKKKARIRRDRKNSGKKNTRKTTRK